MILPSLSPVPKNLSTKEGILLLAAKLGLEKITTVNQAYTTPAGIVQYLHISSYKSLMRLRTCPGLLSYTGIINLSHFRKGVLDG